MILFFAQNKASFAYYQKLAKVLTVASTIEFAHIWRSINLRAFKSFQPSKFQDIFIMFTRESELLGHNATAIQINFFWLKTRYFYAMDIALLTRRKPKMVVIWNGLKYRRAIFSQACEDLSIKTVFMENGLLPDTTVCDQQGVNARNSMPRTADFYLSQSAYSENTINTDLVVRTSKHRKASSQSPLPQRFIFVPFQVDTDSQILLFSPWIKTMQQLFAEMKQIQSNLSGVKLVFKEHPSSPIDYRHLHSQLSQDQGIFANDFSTQELIDRSELIVTINSTVGIEGLLRNKKVISLGEAFYNIEGLVNTVSSQGQLLSVIEDLLSDQFVLDDMLRRNFLSYLSHAYLIPGSWKQASNQHCRATCARLESFYQHIKPMKGVEL